VCHQLVKAIGMISFPLKEAAWDNSPDETEVKQSNHSFSSQNKESLFSVLGLIANFDRGGRGFTCNVPQ